MLLRYLQRATIEKAVKTKQSNGTYTEVTTQVGSYIVQMQEMSDEISASVYGADIFKMIRIKSVNQKLEKFLYEKVNNKDDNVSLYYIILNNRKFKIKAVNSKGVDLELI